MEALKGYKHPVNVESSDSDAASHGKEAVAMVMSPQDEKHGRICINSKYVPVLMPHNSPHLAGHSLSLITLFNLNYLKAK